MTSVYRSLGITCTDAGRDRATPTDWRSLSLPSAKNLLLQSQHGLSQITFHRLILSAHLLTPYLLGMSALRVPLRVANSTTALRRAFTAATPGSSCYFATNSPSRHLSSPLLSKAQPWDQSRGPRSCTPVSRRSYATKTSALFSAETQSNGGQSANTGQTKLIKYLVALGVLGVGAAFFSNEIKHAYHAARRSGRVVGTLAVCINE